MHPKMQQKMLAPLRLGALEPADADERILCLPLKLYELLFMGDMPVAL